jgi:phosphomannomutase
MSLISSVSGIRGTIGGPPGQGLTPVDVVSFTAAYAQWLLGQYADPAVVIGRDARVSGPMVSHLVTGTLIGQGIPVVDIGLSTTPTVELATLEEGQGGLILTASHNPSEWNALKLLDEQGEFLSSEAGEEVLQIARKGSFQFAEAAQLGTVRHDSTYLTKHVNQVCALPHVASEAIQAAGLTVVVDGVNSTGSIVVPQLLRALGVSKVEVINEAADGQFSHNPEPLSENLEGLKHAVQEHSADLGIAVDPDVDRLAFVSEDGTYFGEEYTLVAVADYLLAANPGPVVANLSTTQALQDVVQAQGGSFYPSAVGEAHVVAQMKATNAVLGGEGNGGVIDPSLHYGRDALVGIAYFLSLLANRRQKASELRASYPTYYMTKDKVPTGSDLEPAQVIKAVQEAYAAYPQDTRDGLKLWLQDQSWVHLRRSNTEPVIRIYAESPDEAYAVSAVQQVRSSVEALA